MKNAPDLNLNRYLVFILNVTICGHHCSLQYHSVNHRHCDLSLDQNKSCKKYDINDFKESNTSLLIHLEDGYVQYEDHVVFFKLLKNELSIPEVSGCIRIDKDLHVKLSYKGSPLPLPQWFRHGRDCKLTNKTMLENFPSYIRTECEQFPSIFDELQQIKFKKTLFIQLRSYAMLLCYRILHYRQINYFWKNFIYHHSHCFAKFPRERLML